MQKLKNVKKSIILLAVLVCFTAMFSAGVSTLKVGAEAFDPNQSFYLDNEQMVANSGADEEGCFKTIYDTRIGADASVVFDKLNLIVHIADRRIRVLEDFSDAKLDEFTYETKFKAKRVRDELLDLLIVRKENFFGNDAEFKAWASEYRALIEEKERLLEDLSAKDYLDLEEYVNLKAKEIYDHYKSLVAFTEANPRSNERTSPDFIITNQMRALKDLVAEYVIVESNGGVESYLANKTGAFEYFAETHSEDTTKVHYDTADQIKRDAIERLNGLPKNSIELAYAAYNDWLNVVSNDKSSKLAKEQALEKAKKAAQSAEAVYSNKATKPEVLTKYAAEIVILKGFMSEPDNALASEKVSSKSDNRNVVRVTALNKYTKKEEKVIPKNIELKVYPSFNGSASRNATLQIKEKSQDNSLSVAYLVYMEFYTDYGRVYNLPSTLDGKSIEYKVEIDLNRYYQYYLRGQDYYKDSTTLITDAYNRITKEGYDKESSLCYSYESGAINQLNYTFDGENIVFYTKTFSNFCFAGMDTSTIFQSPLFWVLVVAVVILLIIAIKMVIKHAKYSVKFITNGGSEVKTVKASKNEYFVMPAPPVKQNFVFAGWYTDKALTNKFIGVQMRRRKSIKLYAKWAAPVTKDRLQEFYDILRKTMVGYQKVSFKPTLGVVEKEHLVSMFLRENNVEIYLAEEPENAKKYGFNVMAHSDKKFSLLPCQMLVSSESTFAEALDLIKKVFTDKGLQLRDEGDRAKDKFTVVEDRENGFAYFISNERVANDPADFAELLRIAIKGYVLEEDNGFFKDGDVFTFARVYATEKEAQLYLPLARDEKANAPRDPRFEDTPVLVTIMSASDLPEAYKAIEKVMTSYGFTKHPESSNDLKDVAVPEGHGFAYTLRF